MAGPTDFLRLYQELGLAPGASLDDLRRAYRRRVSELHPDRVGTSYSATVPGAAERLQQITALYGAATQFHRQHGRLPGSAALPPRVTTNSERATPPAARPAPRRARVAWLLAAAGIFAWLVWMPPWSANTSDSDNGAAADASMRAEPQPAADTDEAGAEDAGSAAVLKVGMPAATVLAIQGEPVGRDQGRWDYGPSWISFDRAGKVVDWYSSPMLPLKGATRHPPPAPPPSPEP